MVVVVVTGAATTVAVVGQLHEAVGLGGEGRVGEGNILVAKLTEVRCLREIRCGPQVQGLAGVKDGGILRRLGLGEVAEVLEQRHIYGSPAIVASGHRHDLQEAAGGRVASHGHPGELIMLVVEVHVHSKILPVGHLRARSQVVL